MKKLIQCKAILALICTIFYQTILWIIRTSRDWKEPYLLSTVSLYSIRSPLPQQTLRYLENEVFCPFELLWEKIKSLSRLFKNVYLLVFWNQCQTLEVTWLREVFAQYWNGSEMYCGWNKSQTIFLLYSLCYWIYSRLIYCGLFSGMHW